MEQNQNTRFSNVRLDKDNNNIIRFKDNISGDEFGVIQVITTNIDTEVQIATRIKDMLVNWK